MGMFVCYNKGTEEGSKKGCQYYTDYPNNEKIYLNLTNGIEFLERLSFKLLPRRKQEISLNNSIYKNTSDVISHGTLILNDRFKLYQVVGAYPKNDSYGQYISWNVELQLFNLATADGLPNDFKELIEKNQYGLGKINI